MQETIKAELEKIALGNELLKRVNKFGNSTYESLDTFIQQLYNTMEIHGIKEEAIKEGIAALLLDMQDNFNKMIKMQHEKYKL